MPRSGTSMAVPRTALLHIACRDCDRLHHRVRLPHGSKARCSRCGAVLYRQAADVVDRTLAFSVASLLLFVVANLHPFMSFEVAGRVQVSRMVTGVKTLWEQGYPSLGIIVGFTSIAAPLAMTVMLLYLSATLRFGRRPPLVKPVVLLIERIKPWSMMEIYLLGVIVSAVKLMDMADIVLGPAAFAFMGLIVTLTAAIAVFDPVVVWDRLETAGPDAGGSAAGEAPAGGSPAAEGAT